MRNPKDWHNKATEPILSVLAEARWPLPAKTLDLVINEQLDLDDPPSRATIYTSLDLLAAHGWVEDVSGKRSSAHYVIRDAGREWLGIEE